MLSGPVSIDPVRLSGFDFRDGPCMLLTKISSLTLMGPFCVTLCCLFKVLSKISLVASPIQIIGVAAPRLVFKFELSLSAEGNVSLPIVCIL